MVDIASDGPCLTYLIASLLSLATAALANAPEWENASYGCLRAGDRRLYYLFALHPEKEQNAVL